ncbi:hypothetical protein K438DRAFT_1984840 [Mycena galopus ATCC 62051]|nr:hypothetical protein K438DRAFT_1984840 [Mycena galopus ATCC 62051]
MSWQGSTSRLKILSLSLHSTLVAIHIALLVVWSQGFENRVVSAVETFGTSALRVFITQKLVFRHNLRRTQTVTATHDSLVAWTGLGSALVSVWQQRAIPASIPGVLSAFVYLANILVLHVTFPGLLAVDSVLLNSSVSVITQGLPVFNFPGYDLSNQSDRANAMNRNSAGLYALDSLVSFPFLRINSTEGLYGGTLYDVLQNNPAATGLASVNATGFNISCGYLSITPVGSDTQCPCFYFGGIEYSIGGTSPIVITPFSTTELLQFVAELIFYSSIPILDSNNQTAPWAYILKHMATLHHRSARSLSRSLLKVEDGLEELYVAGLGHEKELILATRT